MRKLFLLLTAFGVVGMSAAQGLNGQMTVAFGWVKQPDGTKKDITGLKLHGETGRRRYYRSQWPDRTG
jgi:hypothetical protein